MLSAFAVNSAATRQANRSKGRKPVMKDIRERRDAERKEITDHAKEHEPPPLK